MGKCLSVHVPGLMYFPWDTALKLAVMLWGGGLTVAKTPGEISWSW